jgi:hypothetical protein
MRFFTTLALWASLSTSTLATIIRRTVVSLQP